MLTARNLASLLLFVVIASASAAAERPNVLLLMSDDQGWWDLGANGNPDISTPNLDRLASEGVNFTRFYAAPVCSPTRAGLMTGRYTLRVGVYNTRFGGDSLDPGETTLADLLRGAGYRTGLFGKWHLGGHARYRPENRGFDVALTFTHGHTERYYYPELRFNGRPVAARGYVTDVLADAAIEFMTSGDDSRPFFAYAPFNTPHSPHFVDDEFLAPYLEKGLALRDARIYGQITQMDRSIGRVLDSLDAHGLADDTLVIFLGDNGGVSRHTRLGLRGGKASPFEGGIRTPLLVRQPGLVPAGRRIDAMVSHLDILPTLCELLEIEPPERPLDGKSIAALLTGESAESPHVFLVHSWDRHRPRLDRGWSVTMPRWKLTYEGLYDLENDLGETKDLSAERPQIAAELREKFVAWLAEMTEGRTFEPPPIEVGRADENPVEIQMSWARLDGTHTTWGSPGSTQTGGPSPLGDPPPGATVNYAFAGYDWDTIEGWRKPGESVRWRIDVVREGVYEIEASYGCDPSDAGGVLRLGVGEQALEVEVKATAGRTVYERRGLGRLRLAAGEAELTARVVRAPGKELMTLNRIWLRRVE